jgi:hypothetical protein
MPEGYYAPWEMCASLMILGFIEYYIIDCQIIEFPFIHPMMQKTGHNGALCGVWLLCRYMHWCSGYVSHIAVKMYYKNTATKWLTCGTQAPLYNKRYGVYDVNANPHRVRLTAWIRKSKGLSPVRAFYGKPLKSSIPSTTHPWLPPCPLRETRRRLKAYGRKRKSKRLSPVRAFYGKQGKRLNSAIPSTLHPWLPPSPLRETRRRRKWDFPCLGKAA